MILSTWVVMHLSHPLMNILICKRHGWNNVDMLRSLCWCIVIMGIMFIFLFSSDMSLCFLKPPQFCCTEHPCSVLHWCLYPVSWLGVYTWLTVCCEVFKVLHLLALTQCSSLINVAHISIEYCCCSHQFTHGKTL